jgi:hypothetical protein
MLESGCGQNGAIGPAGGRDRDPILETWMGRSFRPKNCANTLRDKVAELERFAGNGGSSGKVFTFHRGKK